jgi:hypothetical protein
MMTSPGEVGRNLEASCYQPPALFIVYASEVRREELRCVLVKQAGSQLTISTDFNRTTDLSNKQINKSLEVIGLHSREV